MPSETVIRVAVPAPLLRYFDYLPPSDGAQGIAAGCRVRVPFGRNKVTAVVVEPAASTDIPRNRLRRVQVVLDQTPVLPADVIAMLRWAATYYHHPPGEVMATALPVLLRQGEPAHISHGAWQLTPAGRDLSADALARAPRQAMLWQHLHEAGQPVTATELSTMPGDTAAALRQLRDKGLAETVPVPLTLPEADNGAETAPEPAPAQRGAIERLLESRSAFGAWLLDGITGSGKTEVYLRLIEQVLADGRQALVLVPEIGLTPQLARRLSRRFDAPMALLHSGLNDRERLDAWLRAASGEARIVVGTRSAILTPLASPGLIIVDEEHDISFKQQDGFRYSARDLAIWRARQLDIPVLLGSATPSLESLHNAACGRFGHLLLKQRTGGASLPEMGILDVRGAPMREGISPRLRQAIGEHLEAGGQALLFLNRRGFAPTLRCHDCGWISHCQRCDARLTFHRGSDRGERLVCHHCGAVARRPEQCPQCNSTALDLLGQGTERIEAVLEEYFPDVGIARIDRDAMSRRQQLEQLLGEIRDGSRRLLIGTQMLAKGHHFPDVSLVGILDADHGLFGADFRAGERMAQMIIQVAGRAGRAERAGQVLIQTHHPAHELLTRLLREGYHAWAQAELQQRREAGWPPFTHLALLRAEAADASAPMAFLELARELALPLAGPDVNLLGPVPAAMERRQGRWRARLLIQADERAGLQNLLRRLIPLLAEQKQARKVRWSIDVDPQEIL